MQVPSLTSFGRDDEGVSYRVDAEDAKKVREGWWEKLGAAFGGRGVAGILRPSASE